MKHPKVIDYRGEKYEVLETWEHGFRIISKPGLYLAQRKNRNLWENIGSHNTYLAAFDKVVQSVGRWGQMKDRVKHKINPHDIYEDLPEECSGACEDCELKDLCPNCYWP